MTGKNTSFTEAIKQFDLANTTDPNIVHWEGKSYPKELLYAQRMSERLNEFAPEASEALQLAARCQHICRWKIPRGDYPMDRKGYLRWRNDLQRYHAELAGKIMHKAGYAEDMIKRVQFLLQKKKLKRDPETQILEDVICLVFLEHYFADFAKKYPEKKLLEILEKTWVKMSEKGRTVALEIDFPDSVNPVIQKLLAKNT